LAITSGVISNTTTRPVFAADPVVVSTSQGMAMALSLVPEMETMLATR
jgi:hypothetical protein